MNHAVSFIVKGTTMEIFTLQFWLSVGAIILMDLSLGGDNAVVIAMASNRLPEKERKKAILIGTIGAVGLRMVLTAIAVWLLTIPYLQVLGGILLIPIAIHLLAPGDEDPHIEASDNLWTAVKTIILADFLMSIDNILSVAGAANGDFLLVVFGLMVRIPIIVMGSQLIGKVLDRFPFLMYAGAAMIGWTSGTMFLHDKVLGPVIEDALGGWIETGLPAFLALAVCVLGYLKSHRK